MRLELMGLEVLVSVINVCFRYDWNWVVNTASICLLRWQHFKFALNIKCN